MLGDRHPSTLISVLNVAELLADQGRLDEASALFEEELQARCSEMQAVALVHCTYSVRSCRRDTSTSPSALPLLYHPPPNTDPRPYCNRNQACRKMLGDRHQSTLTSIHNLADLRQEQGRPDEAAELLAEAHALLELGDGDGDGDGEEPTSGSQSETSYCREDRSSEPESPRTPALPDRRSPPSWIT